MIDPIASLRAALAEHRLLVFLAGPNGAGKTTFFERYLEPLGLPFVNADRIARVLREEAPDADHVEAERRAVIQAETIRRGFIEAGFSFCTETVFSDPVGAKVRFLDQARAAGYVVFLVFIGLEGSHLSVARVAERVSHGGHDVPDEKMHARFPRTLANLRAAIPGADEVFLIDNSSLATPYRVIAVYRRGTLVSRHPPLPSWTKGLPGLS